MDDVISNSDDAVDVRDIIERFEALRSEREYLFDALTTARETLSIQPDDTNNGTIAELDADVEAAEAKLDEWDRDYGDELNTLRELLDELKGYGGDHQWQGDWYPGSLIRDSHFEDYAEQLADDIGAIDRNAKWPLNCIDWERAARELQVDYSSVEWGGVTYWYR